MNKRKFWITLFSLLIYIAYPSVSLSEGPNIVAESAILIDADSGQILYEKDCHKIMYPASTTKILTCIIALEETEPNETVTVDDRTPFEVDGGHIALEAGEVLTMDQLLNGLMLNSANDTGMVIARHISGSIESFADLMNKKAKEIGAKNSNFRNPHGLPDKEHTTTAYDLAMIAKYAMKNDEFRHYVSKVEDTIPPTNIKKEPRYLMNSNRMLYSDQEIDIDGVKTTIKYDGITGIKTGYIDDAGNCLVSSAKRGDREYISVVLKTDQVNQYADSHKLLNYAFNSYEISPIAKKDSEIDVESSNKKIKAYLGKNINLDCRVGENPNITTKIEPLEKINSAYLKGDEIAKISYYSNGVEFDNSPLLAAKDSVQGKINNLSKSNLTKTTSFKIFIVVIGIFTILLIILGIRRKIIKNSQLKKMNVEE